MELYSRIKADLYLLMVLLSSISVFAKDMSECPPIVHSLSHYANSFGGYCYIFINEEKYWDDARQYCWNYGGEMLQVDDEATMIFIRSTLNSRDLGWNKNGVWLGAHDQHKEGHWIWSSNKPMKYDYWARGQPRSILGTGISFEDCACMRKSDNWRWHDCPCKLLGWKYNFICQYPLSKGTEINYHTGSLDSNHKDRGANIAIAVVSVCAVLLLLCLVFLIYRRRQRKKPNHDDEPPRFENLSYAQLRRGETEGAEPDAACFTANQMNSLYEEVNKPVNHGVNYYSNINEGACAEALLTPKVTNDIAAKENNNAGYEKVVAKPPPVKIVNNQLYDIENKIEDTTDAPVGATAESETLSKQLEEEEENHYEDMN